MPGSMAARWTLKRQEHEHAVLVARLDNLGKGASGAAVQNLQLMLGGEM
jgi:N-acetyl-gamma-glutamylphosphate reductase